MVLVLFLTQGIFAQILPNANGVVFVNINVSGGDSSGNSWINAVPQLGDALKAAHNNAAIRQIWVAKGTYAPMYSAGSDGMNQYLYFGVAGGAFNTFLLVNNVKLYGGFQNANETSISQRDTVNNNTVLNGTSCNHVVMSVGNVGTAEVNGFTISGARGIAMQNLTVNATTTFSARGGGVYIESGSPVISNCTITGNYSEWGAGIYANNSTLTVKNTTVSNNHATGGSGFVTGSQLQAFGGGIYVRDGISVSINNCNISDNTASATKVGGWGGGLCISGYTCRAEIRNTIVRNNKISTVVASSSNENGNAIGGGIYLVTAATTIDSCTISNNSATVVSGTAANTGINYYYAGGGGILSGSPLVISNSIISNNSISATVNPANNIIGWCAGGGIMNDGSLIPGNAGPMLTGSNSTINNCTIEGNSSRGNFNPSGGGVGYSTVFLLPTPVIPRINNSIIRNNIAEGYGGAVHCLALPPQIKNTLIENNKATDGGAIYNVAGNQAAKPLLVNCTLYGNSTTDVNANIITNKDSCTTTVHNSILSGNKSNVTGPGTTITYSVVQGNTLYPGIGNSNADPLFTNAAGGNYILQTTSPAVNTGSDIAYGLVGNISTDKDLAGDLRLYGRRIDMGALELQRIVEPSSVTTSVNNAERNLMAYPNPVRAGQALVLRCNYSPAILAGAKLTVMNIAGQVQQTSSSVQPEQTLTIHPAGLYFIVLTLRDGNNSMITAIVE